MSTMLLTTHGRSFEVIAAKAPAGNWLATISEMRGGDPDTWDDSEQRYGSELSAFMGGLLDLFEGLKAEGMTDE
jgi:hypothetical protein